jgi:hypothetical protein
MLLKTRHARRRLLTIGMTCLLLASLGRWFVHPANRGATDIADAINGLLLGVAIAATLLSVRAARSNRAG